MCPWGSETHVAPLPQWWGGSYSGSQVETVSVQKAPFHPVGQSQLEVEEESCNDLSTWAEMDIHCRILMFWQFWWEFQDRKYFRYQSKLLLKLPSSKLSKGRANNWLWDYWTPQGGFKKVQHMEIGRDFFTGIISLDKTAWSVSPPIPTPSLEGKAVNRVVSPSNWNPNTKGTLGKGLALNLCQAQRTIRHQCEWRKPIPGCGVGCSLSS